MDSAGSAGLQSGFVLAVVLGAVLFAGRIGGTDEVARRIYQVALAATLAFAVIAGVTAFIRPPSTPPGFTSGSSSSSGSSSATPGGSSGDSSSSSSSSSPNDKTSLAYFKDVADHNATSRTVRAGLGLLILIGGLAAMRRRPTIALGTALGGLLLLLFGGSAATSSTGGGDIFSSLLGAYSGLIGGALGTSSRNLDIAHFCVLAAGAVALVLFGLTRWDADAPAVAAPAPVIGT